MVSISGCACLHVDAKSVLSDLTADTQPSMPPTSGALLRCYVFGVKETSHLRSGHQSDLLYGRVEVKI